MALKFHKLNKKGKVMLEKAVEQYLKSKVEQLGGMCLKFTSPGIRGVPDRMVIYKGQVNFVEVKRPGGNLRANQKLVRDKFKRHGIDIHVVYSKETVDTFIKNQLIGVDHEM